MIVYPKDKNELKFLLLNTKMSDIDTCNITDMSELFMDDDRPNSDFDGIEYWDVSNVTNMDRLFMGATNFNQPLHRWNVSNVTSLRQMFKHAHNFNQTLNNWDVSNVRDFESMFESAFKFNQPIKDWKIKKAANMNRMFMNAYDFNQDLRSWDVGSIPPENLFKNSAMQNINKPVNTLMLIMSEITGGHYHKHNLEYKAQHGNWPEYMLVL